MFRVRRIILFVYYIINPSIILGQEVDSLSLRKALEPIEIIAYFNQQPLLGITSSAQLISARKIEIQQTTTLLPALNSVPGIRMEERSTGSYRLSIRGSLIRSPFGVRNIKIYMDEFPLTDAGGNTYINLIDPVSINSIHIMKGPDGSLYGANSGGVIRMQPNGLNVLRNQISLLLNFGSFGLIQQHISVQKKLNDKYSFSIDQSFTSNNGYRENSSLKKKTFQTAHKYEYSKKNQMRFIILFTDIDYLTPGGLTKNEMYENPRMSRPGSDSILSAKEQKAGVTNKTLFGGIVHEANFTNKVLHSFSIFGSYTNFENSFISNYEIRKEKNLGVRTWLSFKDTVLSGIRLQIQLGLEGQKGWNSINNFYNDHGHATKPQAFDDLDNSYLSYFIRTMVKLYDKLTIETSLGLNSAEILYTQMYPIIPIPSGRILFDDILMPRIAASYLVNNTIAIRGSVSKGYSLPTISEIRSSDKSINTYLKPEEGINYEVGLRLEMNNGRLIGDLSYYHYKMNNGIVRQVRESGDEHYINAGVIKQRSIEASGSADLLMYQNKGLLRALNYQTSFTYNNFKFEKYRVNGNDFTNNRVTGVPDFIWINTLLLTFPLQLGLNISQNYTSSTPLNDANTFYSKKFHLIQLKAIWNHQIFKTLQIQLFIGIDNLLDEKYSLGNDINAFGHRFYNPAPERNYYGGLKMRF
jgi:iron complex outermembrane receptor protein